MGTKKKAKKKVVARKVVRKAVRRGSTATASLRRLSAKVEAEVAKLLEQERAGKLTPAKLETGLEELTKKLAQMTTFLHEIG